MSGYPLRDRTIANLRHSIQPDKGLLLEWVIESFTAEIEELRVSRETLPVAISPQRAAEMVAEFAGFTAPIETDAAPVVAIAEPETSKIETPLRPKLPEGFRSPEGTEKLAEGWKVWGGDDARWCPIPYLTVANGYRRRKAMPADRRIMVTLKGLVINHPPPLRCLATLEGGAS
jgi:hypothetical protein